VLQCVAVCCSVMQCVVGAALKEACDEASQVVCCGVVPGVAGCCSVLQCVAVWCRVVQSVAICCSVLQVLRARRRGMRLRR